MSLVHEAIAKAANLIRQADALLIAAGAGMGVDSGLPDFRGANGLWGVYPALGRAKLHFEEIANPQAFVERPELAWGFYGHRLNTCTGTHQESNYLAAEPDVAWQPV